MFKICILVHMFLHAGHPDYMRDKLQIIQPKAGVNTHAVADGLMRDVRQMLELGLSNLVFEALHLASS